MTTEKELCEGLEKTLRAAETAVKSMKAIGADAALLRSVREVSIKSVKDTLDILAAQAGWPDLYSVSVDINGLTDRGESVLVRLSVDERYDERANGLFKTAQEGFDTILRNPARVHAFVSRDDGTTKTKVMGTSIDEVLEALDALGERVRFVGQPKCFRHVVYGYKRARSFMLHAKNPYLRIGLMDM